METIELTGPNIGDFVDGYKNKVDALAPGQDVVGTIVLKSTFKKTMLQKINEAGGIGEFEIILEGVCESYDSFKQASNQALKSMERDPLAALVFGTPILAAEKIRKDKSQSVTFYKESLGKVTKETETRASFQLPIRAPYLPPTFKAPGGCISYTITAVHPSGHHTTKPVKMESWPMVPVPKLPDGKSATLGKLLVTVTVAADDADIVVPSLAKPARLPFRIRFANAPPTYEESPGADGGAKAVLEKSGHGGGAMRWSEEVADMKVEVKYRLRSYSAWGAGKVVGTSYGEGNTTIDISALGCPAEGKFEAHSHDFCSQTPGGPTVIPAREKCFNYDAPPMEADEPYVFRNWFYLEVDFSTGQGGHEASIQIPVSLQVKRRKRKDIVTPYYVMLGLGGV